MEKVLFAMQNLTVWTHFQQHIPCVMWGCTYNLHPILQRVAAIHYNSIQIGLPTHAMYNLQYTQ